MNVSDRTILEQIERKVGRPVPHRWNGERCVELDLTAEDSLFSGLIRRHSPSEKDEIMQLIGHLTALKHLNLRRNKLHQLPANFENLSELEQLNLGSNYLGSVPPEIRHFQQLKYLQLANNDITILPEFIGSYRQLEYLTLHKNINLKSVDALAPLTSLKSLNLYFLNLVRLPAFVYRFNRLVTLTLWNMRDFTDDLATLGNLEYFSVCGTPSLRELPPALTQLKKLRMIRVFQNSLDRLPGDFGELENLEQISLYQNQLTQLPESMARLQKLKKLNLGWNRLARLPEFIARLPVLEWLAVFENPLDPAGESPRFAPTTTVLREWPFTTLAVPGK